MQNPRFRRQPGIDRRLSVHFSAHVKVAFAEEDCKIRLGFTVRVRCVEITEIALDIAVDADITVRDIVPSMKEGISGRYDLAFDAQRVVAQAVTHPLASTCHV